LCPVCAQFRASVMPNTPLTDLTIRSLRPTDDGQRTDYWDTKFPSFGVRVGPRSKTFIGRLGSGRVALGSYPDMSLQEARRRLLALKSVKPMPRRETTFLEAYKAFKAIHCSQKKERTQRDYLRMLDVHFLPTLGDMRLDAIDHHHIVAITDGLIKTPSECRHAIAVGRTFFKFCVRRHYIPASPMEGMQLPKHTPRDRVLTDAELKAIWHATGDGKIFSNIVRLLILTGQRRGEIGQLRTDWIKHNNLCLPATITKNGRAHTIPLGSLSLSIIPTAAGSESSIVFPARGDTGNAFNGWMKTKLALDKKLGADFAPWTLHDLRRTFATNLAALGIRLEVIEKLLNHVSGSLVGIVGIYQRHDFKDEMRDAVTKWETKLSAVVTA
jgi:integrase